ncbi:hypothetical protein CAPTEDRAFT_192038 [Capitella teleta]|uniref:Uncharacterized protein n=1 Tax=Capitella teleta TaxID=283909 RepID=R7TAW0_CAPTE|nr:hypothetical protein CAPTEDRAFT_192038 [Capitella teleta]|eukprot:ELT90652.1 hypothetical protein CAPTEDRAFT_192038 [Capitella teleta]
MAAERLSERCGSSSRGYPRCYHSFDGFHPDGGRHQESIQCTCNLTDNTTRSHSKGSQVHENNIMLNLSVVLVLALFVCGLQAAVNDTDDMANMKADLLVHIVREMTSFPEVCNDCSTLSELKMQGACCCFSDATCRHIEVPGCNNELWAKFREQAQP